jgi:glycine cleavage system aminomethyltransferase T
MRLISPDDGKDVGWITSVTTSARLGKRIALGFVKRGYQEIGTRFQAISPDGPQAESIAVEVVPLPFV